MKRGEKLTVLPVVEDLLVLFDVGPERLLHRLHRQLRRQRTVEELAYGRPSDDLGPGEPRHFAEAIAAVNDVTAAWLGVGDEEASI